MTYKIDNINWKLIERENEKLEDRMFVPGMKCLGNKKLWYDKKERIAVFASRSQDPVVAIAREHWAKYQGRYGKCIVSTFHSRAECEILFFVLTHGGSAIWLLGRSLPTELNGICKMALRQKRLLIISCFNRDHHTRETSRYCAHLAATKSKHHVYWSLNESGVLASIYNRAVAKNYQVERF